MAGHKPFDGDGRKKVRPIDPPDGTAPLAVTNATGSRLYEHFLQTGNSYHSGRGGTLWVIKAACEANGTPYKIERLGQGGEIGYLIRRLKVAGQDQCRICGRALDNPEDPLSEDCGGDCLKCMADCGDPHCVDAVERITVSASSAKRSSDGHN
ncbi:hypothetical protein [Burkholderia arboris]|uniref:hypothetical protein n=1 Tax=Burkholderia arboris TaxID=488730 RepID=UPI001CF288B3|nr:hypothetical protein [Burkholderia arboris]MCA8050806.1 hypothetical protein [Burkholderia arboris]